MYRQGITFQVTRWIATVIIIEDDMYTDDVTLGQQISNDTKYKFG